MKSLNKNVVVALAAGLLPLYSGAVEIKRFNPETLSQPDGYSQVVTVSGPARTILLGGKAGLYPDGSWPESLAEQSKLTWENIDKALFSI